MFTDNKVYCPLPFREMMLIPGNIMLLCGGFSTNIDTKNNVKDTFYNGEVESIRNDMIKGIPIKGCEQCYKEECIGVKSYRQENIEKYGYLIDVKIKSLTIQFDNVCNLKCRSCASPQSSKIHDDEIKVYGRALLDNKYRFATGFEDLDYQEITDIQMHGGEPFLSKKADEFFKKLIDQGVMPNIHIRVITNATITPNNNILKSLEICKNLTIHSSVDGYGKLNDYFRSGSNFDIVVKNLKFFEELKSKRPPGTTILGINTAVNVYNINKLEELDHFFKLNFPSFNLNKNLVSRPEYLCITYLPNDYKELVRPSLKNYKELLSVLDTSGGNYFSEFVTYHQSLDLIRNETLGDCNSLLNEYINNYKLTKSVSKADMFKILKWGI